MKTRCHIALAGGALLAVAAAVANAESSGDELKATPYRPTVSNPADLPMPGHFEWEAGGYSERDAGDAQFLSALSFAAAPTLVFDGGALFGLNRESPRYGLFAGVTMLVR